MNGNELKPVNAKSGAGILSKKEMLTSCRHFVKVIFDTGFTWIVIFDFHSFIQ